MYAPTSVANTTAKLRNWASFDPCATGTNLVLQFTVPITINVISMGLYRKLGYLRPARHGLEVLAPWFGKFFLATLAVTRPT